MLTWIIVSVILVVLATVTCFLAVYKYFLINQNQARGERIFCMLFLVALVYGWIWVLFNSPLEKLLSQ